MPTYRLSPSSLTFLYHECPRCFRNQVLGIWKRPYLPFPSVFGRIDKAMRNHYHGTCPSAIDGNLPTGAIDCTEKTITSSEISVPGCKSTVVISGKTDAIAHFHNGTIGILDFKTSEQKESSLQIYKAQLHAYSAILANPKKGEPLVTSQMGLVCVEPQEMKADGDRALFEMSLSYQPIQYSTDWWAEFLAGVINLLDGVDIDPPENCFFCKAQTAFDQAPF